MTVYRDKKKQMTYQEMMFHLEKCKDEQFKFINDFSTKIRLFLDKFRKETGFINFYFCDHHYSKNENDRWFKFNFNEKFCLLRVNFKIKLNNVEIDILKEFKFHWNYNEISKIVIYNRFDNSEYEIYNSSVGKNNFNDLLEILSNEAENKIKQFTFGDFSETKNN